jgi:hypothetical protein
MYPQPAVKIIHDVFKSRANLEREFKARLLSGHKGCVLLVLDTGKC